MTNIFDMPLYLFRSTTRNMMKTFEVAPKIVEASLNHTLAAQTYWLGMTKYVNAFMAPLNDVLCAFVNVERKKLLERSPMETARSYGELMEFNLKLGSKGLSSGLAAMSKYSSKKISEMNVALTATFYGENGNNIARFAAREREVMDVAVNQYPRAIREVKSEYGFDFDRGNYEKTAETERFELYRVLPLDEEVERNEDRKPIMIIPPYVLGPNILSFLPGEDRSYSHCYANQGIPTYIRIVKDIDVTPAVQLMTGEEDALDIKYFAQVLKEKHGRAVTLNGFCQGGYHSIAALLSGELDGLVDALITCATPVDGTRSKSLMEYMRSLPPRFRGMEYALKTLPNGNRVVDGRIMAAVYKLRKMESESPIAAFYRDLSLFDDQRGRRMKISKTAAAINYWVSYEQQNLPVEIIKMSFESYTTPIDADGFLPVKLFGRKLNLKRFNQMGVPWLICIADKDDLVDKESSLMPLDFIDAEVCVFPKGHAAIATSWSVPTSECALHLRFCAPCSDLQSTYENETYRGPVRFHLDLERGLMRGDDQCEILEDALEHAEMSDSLLIDEIDGDKPRYLS